MHNKNLEDIALKREEERKKLIERCQELLEKNTKLKKQVTVQMACRDVGI